MKNSQEHRFQGIFAPRKAYASKSFNAKKIYSGIYETHSSCQYTALLQKIGIEEGLNFTMKRRAKHKYPNVGFCKNNLLIHKCFDFEKHSGYWTGDN